MKKFTLLFCLVTLFFSCAKDDFHNPDDNEIIEIELDERDIDAPGCSLTFLGYDENGCCIYRFNLISFPIGPVDQLSSDGDNASFSTPKPDRPCRYYIMVGGQVIRGNTFTTCESSVTVRYIKECNQTAYIICSATATCDRWCDECDENWLSTTASPAPNEDGNQCCFVSVIKEGPFSICDSNGGANGIYPQDGVTITSLAGSPVSTGYKICWEPGVDINLTGWWDIKRDGEVICPRMEVEFDLGDCHEDCDECDENWLSITTNPAPPENGNSCCYVGLKKEGPLYICDSGGNTSGIYPQDGVTITGLAGSPATSGWKVCWEPGVDLNMTGFWDTTDAGTPICPRMEEDFNLGDCVEYCEDCDDVSLSVSMSPALSQPGESCCNVTVQKVGDSDFCGINPVNTSGIHPQTGVTITGLGGSPVSSTWRVCAEAGANLSMTAFWEFSSGGELICPTMEEDFNLGNCN